MIPKIKRRQQRAWSDENYVTAYELARAGYSNLKIAEAMNVTEKTLIKWRKRDKNFQSAIDRGREYEQTSDGQKTVHDYIYDRLPEDLQDLWDDIRACEKRGAGIERIEALFENQGKQARQRLFLYALTATGFNVSKALKKVNINKTTLDYWKESDPGFSKLCDEMRWHQGNFFEAALVRAVKTGDVQAAIFANKTFNKDRGYGAKMEIEMKGQVNHVHAIVDLDKLNLSLETRKEILLALETDGQMTFNPTQLIEDNNED